MKTFFDSIFRAGFTVAAFVCLLCASASAAPGPVGPKREQVGAVTGYLKVYNSTREYGNGDILYYPHRRYFIYTLGGAKYKTVTNRTSRKDEEPVKVLLPAGEYYVLAESDSLGLVRVPVIIKGGETTVVNLERKKDVPPSER